MAEKVKKPSFDEAVLDDLRALVDSHQVAPAAYGTSRAVSICLMRAADRGSTEVARESAVETNLRLLENSNIPLEKREKIKTALKAMRAASPWFAEIFSRFAGLKRELQTDDDVWSRLGFKR